MGAAVCLLIRLAYAKIKKCPLEMAGGIKWAVFAAYAAGVLAVLLRPREWRVGGGGYNLIPLQSIRAELTGNLPPHDGTEALRLGMDILLFNLVIFVPLGIFLPMLFEKCRKWYVTAAVCLGMAVVVEAIQYFIGRTADIDDVLLRLLGCMAAYAVYQVVSSLWKKHPAGGWNAMPAVQ